MGLDHGLDVNQRCFPKVTSSVPLAVVALPLLRTAAAYKAMGCGMYCLRTFPDFKTAIRGLPGAVMRCKQLRGVRGGSNPRQSAMAHDRFCFCRFHERAFTANWALQIPEAPLGLLELPFFEHKIVAGFSSKAEPNPVRTFLDGVVDGLTRGCCLTALRTPTAVPAPAPPSPCHVVARGHSPPQPS